MIYWRKCASLTGALVNVSLMKQDFWKYDATVWSEKQAKQVNVFIYILVNSPTYWLEITFI